MVPKTCMAGSAREGHCVDHGTKRRSVNAANNARTGNDHDALTADRVEAALARNVNGHPGRKPPPWWNQATGGPGCRHPPALLCPFNLLTTIRSQNLFCRRDMGAQLAFFEA